MSKISMIFPMLIVCAGCATPTIKDSVKITPISVASSSLHGGRLLGGDGLDWGNAIVSRDDGSYVLFGYTWKSFGESTDLFVASYGPDDELLWANTYGGTHKEYLKQGILTRDGGYLLSGGSQSLFFTALKVFSPARPPRPIALKLDAVGAVEWAMTIDDWRLEVEDVIQMKDGTYLFVGDRWEAEDSDNVDIYAMKVSAQGAIVWAYRYDGNLIDVAFGGVRGNVDASAVIAGYTMVDQGSANLLVMKIDRQGLPLWAKSYEAEKHQTPAAMTSFPDGTYAVTGWSGEQDPPEKDIFVTRVSGEGELMWYQLYGTPDRDEALSILKGHGADIVVVGRTGMPEQGQEDGTALLIGSDGVLKAATLVQGHLNDELMAAAVDARDGYLLFGDTESFSASYADQLLFRWSPGAAQATAPFSQRALNAKSVSMHVGYLPLDIRRTDISDHIETKRLTVRQTGGRAQ